MFNSICYLELQIEDYTKTLSLLKWEEDTMEDCYNEGTMTDKYFNEYKKKAKMKRVEIQNKLDRCYIQIKYMQENNPFSKKERC